MTTLFESYAATLEQRGAGIFHPVNTYGGNVLKKFRELAQQQLQSASGNLRNGFETRRPCTFAVRSVAVAQGAVLRAPQAAGTWTTADLPAVATL